MDGRVICSPLDGGGGGGTARGAVTGGRGGGGLIGYVVGERTGVSSAVVLSSRLDSLTCALSASLCLVPEPMSVS